MQAPGNIRRYSILFVMSGETRNDCLNVSGFSSWTTTLVHLSTISSPSFNSLLQLANNHGNDRIHSDSWVIVFSDPFRLYLLAILNNDKIKPSRCVPICFFTVAKMHNEHQSDKCGNEQDCAGNPNRKKHPIKTPNKIKILRILNHLGRNAWLRRNSRSYLISFNIFSMRPLFSSYSLSDEIMIFVL